MVSLVRAFRGSNSTPKRASSASTVTHTSTSKHHHSSSAFASATKRIASVFDSSSRSSWIPGSGSSSAMDSTTNIAALPDDDVNDDDRPLLMSPASVSDTSPIMSSTGGGGSSDPGKKIRSITPKILALKAMFEHRNGSGASSGSGSHSAATAVAATSEAGDREVSKFLAPQQNHRDGDNTSVISSLAPSSSTAASTTDYYNASACQPHDTRLSTDGSSCPPPPPPPPPAITARQPNIITRMASRAELVLKRKASSRSAATTGTAAGAYAAAIAAGGEPAAVRSWREKVDALAAWAARCQAEGRMPELDAEALCTPTDIVLLTMTGRERERAGGAATPLPIIHSEETLQGTGLLTPEEDLAECVGQSGSHAYLAGYFALVLNEAKSISHALHTVLGSTENGGWAREAALYLVHHPNRVPLVFRIEAAHLLAAAGTGAVAVTVPAPGAVTDCGASNISRASYASRDTSAMTAAASMVIAQDDEGPAPDRAGLLREAWRWCHQLETTPLVLLLLHRTQLLWTECVGALEGMEDVEYGPPSGGYA